MIVEHKVLIGYGLRISTRELGYLQRENNNRDLSDLFPSSKFTRLGYAMGDTRKMSNVCFVGIEGSIVSLSESGMGVWYPEELMEAVDDTSYDELQTVALEARLHRSPNWYIFLYR